MRVALLSIALASSRGLRVPTASRANVRMATATPASTSKYFSDLEDATGVYSFTHPGGEFEVHLRDKGRFWAPRF